MPRFITFLCGALLLAGTAIAADELRKDYSNKELVRFLRDDGYSAVKIADTDDERRLIEIKVNGSHYLLQIFDDGDLLLYFGMTGFDISKDAINEWNRQQRLVRAYIDHENDPILEADLLANAGYSERQFTEFLKVFVQLSVEFQSYLREVDGIQPQHEDTHQTLTL